MSNRTLVRSHFRTISRTITPTVMAAPKAVWVTAAQYEELETSLGAGSVALEMFRVRTPRAAGMTVRALRAVGAGGTCPYFGLDFANRTGVHHPADCGKEHDGKFAKAGNRTSAGKPGSGYEGHMEWVNDTPSSVIDAAKKAAKKSAS